MHLSYGERKKVRRSVNGRPVSTDRPTTRSQAQHEARKLFGPGGNVRFVRNAGVFEIGLDNKVNGGFIPRASGISWDDALTTARKL